MGVWFERLQAAFYEADDLLDEFQYEALRREVLLLRTKNNHRRSIGIQKLVHKFFSCSHALAFRFKFRMGCRIEKLRKKLDMIADDRARFPYIIPTEDRQTDRNAASSSLSSNANESGFVGRDHNRTQILQLLMTPPPSVDEKIAVIPIVGIGGLGKTALVKSLYDHEMVVKHFELRIWVKVAQDFNVKHVMRKLIQCIPHSPCADLNSNQLKKLLQENLHDRNFLLVLDDLCDCDYRDWLKFMSFLGDGGAKGSKIIVTTRTKSVAITVGTVPMYNLDRQHSQVSHCCENLT